MEEYRVKSNLLHAAIWVVQAVINGVVIQVRIMENMEGR